VDLDQYQSSENIKTMFPVFKPRLACTGRPTFFTTLSSAIVRHECNTPSKRGLTIYC